MKAKAKRAQRARAVPTPKRRRLESREGAVITSLAIPRPLHQEARIASVRLNWTLAEIVREALEEWLERHGADVAKGAVR